MTSTCRIRCRLAMRQAPAYGVGRVTAAPFASSRHIVQRPGNQARGRGLAHAAHPGEHIGLGDAAARKRIAQRLHHGVLADQLGEQLRPIFAGERCMALTAGSGRERGAGFRRLLPGALRRALFLVFVFGHGRSDFHAEVGPSARSKAGSRPLRTSGYGAREVGGWTNNPRQSR